jgi:hypothetical protein
MKSLHASAWDFVIDVSKADPAMNASGAANRVVYIGDFNEVRNKDTKFSCLPFFSSLNSVVQFSMPNSENEGTCHPSPSPRS